MSSDKKSIQRSLLTIGHRRPGRISGRTIEANFVGFDRFEFLELIVFVSGGNANFSLSRGGEVSIVSQISCNVVRHDCLTLAF